MRIQNLVPGTGATGGLQAWTSDSRIAGVCLLVLQYAKRSIDKAMAGIHGTGSVLVGREPRLERHVVDSTAIAGTGSFVMLCFFLPECWPAGALRCGCCMCRKTLQIVC